MAQGVKIRTKTHGLNPNFCCQIQTGTGHSHNWHGPDLNLAHLTRSLAWAKKQGFRVREIELIDKTRTKVLDELLIEKEHLIDFNMFSHLF